MTNIASYRQEKCILEQTGFLLLPKILRDDIGHCLIIVSYIGSFKKKKEVILLSALTLLEWESSLYKAPLTNTHHWINTSLYRPRGLHYLVLKFLSLSTRYPLPWTQTIVSVKRSGQFVIVGQSLLWWKHCRRSFEHDLICNQVSG